MNNPWKENKELKKQIEELRRTVAIMEETVNGECTIGNQCSVCNNGYRYTGILGNEYGCKLIATKKCKRFEAVSE